MADRESSSSTAIVAIVVLAILALFLFLFFFRTPAEGPPDVDVIQLPGPSEPPAEPAP